MTVMFKSGNSYKDTTINDIKVIKGKDRKIADITLKK